jgi:hypothetical protein
MLRKPANRSVKPICINLILSLVVALLLSATPARAMTGGTVTSSAFTCTQVSITYTTINFDRNNTGGGAESYTFTIVDGNGTILFTVTSSVAVGGNIPGQTEVFVYGTAPTANPIQVTFVSNAGNGYGLQTLWNFEGECPGLPSVGGKFFNPGDDRLNRDPGQPAALYCRNQGEVHVYAINVDDSKGKLALVVTRAEIDAVIDRNPAANTLVKQSPDGRFKLYYLPATKELLFNTVEVRSGKPYSFIWKGLCR